MSIETRRMSLKQILKIGFIAYLTLFLSPLKAGEEAAQSLSAILNHYQTLKGDFEQKTLDSTGKLVESTHGEIAFQRPDLFRWYTLTPTKQLILNQGNKLAIYDVDLEQVTYKNVDEQYGATPALLLSGNVDKLKQQYRIEACPNSTDTCYQLLAKDSNDVFKRLTLLFKNDILKMMVIDNNLDQTTLIRFKNLDINASLPHSLFALDLPAGVDVVQ